MYREDRTILSSFTKEDKRNLQVQQNQVCRLLLPHSELAGSNYINQNLSTKELLTKAGELSVHQLGAMSTVMLMKKTLVTGKPNYIASKITSVCTGDNTSGRTIQPRRKNLNLSCESFI